MTLPSSCTLVSSDTASNPDPIPFWGQLDCQNAGRQQQVSTGGDPSVTALGTSQANSAFRQMTVMDGDDVWGERCEGGYNWSQSTGGGGTPGPGPTVAYYNGTRRATYISIKAPSGVDVNDPHWRTVMQMKQTEPYTAPWDAGQGQVAPGPMIEMQLRSGAWTLINDWHTLWTAPAQAGVWTRFAYDVTYSPDPSVGSIKVYADLNSDGDFSDSGEQSPTFHVSTLSTESQPGGANPYTAGQPIPDHLRAGIYQDPVHNCVSGCSMDLDNVQIVRP